MSILGEGKGVVSKDSKFERADWVMYPPYGLPHGVVILHRGLPGALLCAAAPLANPFGVYLAQERPRRLVIGHVLLRGHARNGAADRAIVTASALNEQ